MKPALKRLFAPYQSGPRRWLLVGALLLVILGLALAGFLR